MASMSRAPTARQSRQYQSSRQHNPIAHPQLLPSPTWELILEPKKGSAGKRLVAFPPLSPPQEVTSRRRNYFSYC